MEQRSPARLPPAVQHNGSRQPVAQDTQVIPLTRKVTAPPRVQVWAGGGWPERQQTIRERVRTAIAEQSARPPQRRQNNSTRASPTPITGGARTAEMATPPLRLTTAYRASIPLVFRRVFSWVGAVLFFAFGTLGDMMRGRNTAARRAFRLRRAFERAGGAAIKVGQQLSIRIDLLPAVYCEALARLLDDIPPITPDGAIAALEQHLRQPVSAVFSHFDPHPIGSASIACVYRATLRENGQPVALKIRRPGIERVFAADLRALDLLLGVAEWLTILRPGFSTSLRAELRSALFGELDFRREARFATIFHQAARRVKSKRAKPFTSPVVYARWSGEAVIVQEYVTGVWVNDLLAMLERGDAAELAQLEAMDIHPRTVARTLLYADYWSVYEQLIFHADPHPANLVVRPGGELVLVDFGACGILDEGRRDVFLRFLAAQTRNDAWGMAQMSLILVEPLPAVDLNALARDLEAAFHTHLLAFRDPNAPWYEKTSASLWLSFLGLVNQYRIPVPTSMLLLIRATLLYDTLAVRLWPTMDIYREFQYFARRLHTRAERRVRRAVSQRLQNGLTGNDALRLERLAQASDGLLFRAQRLLNAPYDFATAAYQVEKGFFSILVVLRLLVQAGLLTAGAVLLHLLTMPNSTLGEAWQAISRSSFYHVGLLLLALIAVRGLFFRLGEKRGV